MATGPGPPTAYEKDSVCGLTCNGAAGGVTVRLTATVCVPLAEPGEAMLTVPLYVPVDKPAAFTETLSVAGVTPLAGLNVIHAALAVAVTLALPGLADTLTDCAAGVAPPL